MELLKKHIEELINACNIYQVEKLYIFGSILRRDFDDKSDIDFIVSLTSKDPVEYAENYFNLKFELEKIFNRKIDLLEQKAIKNKTFENIINKEKKLVYDRTNKNLA